MIGRDGYRVGGACDAAGVDDEQLMSAGQQFLLRTVVDAINRGEDFYAAAYDRISPEPASDEIRAVVRILRLVDFRFGEPSSMVLRRVLGLLRARTADKLDTASRRPPRGPC